MELEVKREIPTISGNRTPTLQPIPTAFMTEATCLIYSVNVDPGTVTCQCTHLCLRKWILLMYVGNVVKITERAAGFILSDLFACVGVLLIMLRSFSIMQLPGIVVC